MDFEGKVRPIDAGVTKIVLLSLAVIILAIGAAIFTLTYVLAGKDISPAVYGILVIWVGSMAFFYAVITEEHTMKEIFIRQSYFFTGLMSMILGMFFISLGGLVTKQIRIGAMEFGVLLLIMGAGLTLLSAQRTGDYSKRSAFMGMFAGILLAIGGLMAGSINVAIGGVFIVILSAFWLGMRNPHSL